MGPKHQRPTSLTDWAPTAHLCPRQPRAQVWGLNPVTWNQEGLRPAPPRRTGKTSPPGPPPPQPFALKLPFPPVHVKDAASSRSLLQAACLAATHPPSPTRSLPHQCWAARGPLGASTPSSAAEQGPRGVRTALWVRTRNGCPRQQRQLRWACSQTTTSGRVSICGDPPSTRVWRPRMQRSAHTRCQGSERNEQTLRPSSDTMKQNVKNHQTAAGCPDAKQGASGLPSEHGPDKGPRGTPDTQDTRRVETRQDPTCLSLKKAFSVSGLGALTCPPQAHKDPPSTGHAASKRASAPQAFTSDGWAATSTSGSIPGPHPASLRAKCPLVSSHSHSPNNTPQPR